LLLRLKFADNQLDHVIHKKNVMEDMFSVLMKLVDHGKLLALDSMLF